MQEMDYYSISVVLYAVSWYAVSGRLAGYLWPVRASPETGIVTVEVQQQHDHVRIPSTSFAIQTVRPFSIPDRRQAGLHPLSRTLFNSAGSQPKAPAKFISSHTNILLPSKKKKSFSSHLHCFRNVFLLGLFLIMGILYIT
jgi:hypothetical protein